MPHLPPQEKRRKSHITRAVPGYITSDRIRHQCDKAVPSCGNCKRSGIKCEGYTDAYVWVPQSREEDRDSHTASKPDSIQTGQQTETTQQGLIRYRNYDDALSVALPTALSKSAREQLYFGLFTDAMFPSGRVYSQEATKLSSVSWSRHISTLYTTEAALRYATLAVSSSIIGRQQGDMQLRLKGIQMYNMAVLAMARALKQPDWYLRDGLIVAARVMANFEVSYSPDNGS